MYAEWSNINVLPITCDILIIIRSYIKQLSVSRCAGSGDGAPNGQLTYISSRYNHIKNPRFLCLITLIAYISHLSCSVFVIRFVVNSEFMINVGLHYT